MAHSACSAFLSVSLVMTLAACGGAESSEADADSSTLRTLARDEVLGTIGYGEVKRVDYTESPLYRAFQFTGNVGDAIDIRVSTTTAGTDPVAWLLDSQQMTLVRNDNENELTRDARIQKTLSRPGTYYIVVRESNREDATFNVSLNAIDASPPAAEPAKAQAKAASLIDSDPRVHGVYGYYSQTFCDDPRYYRWENTPVYFSGSSFRIEVGISTITGQVSEVGGALRFSGGAPTMIGGGAKSWGYTTIDSVSFGTAHTNYGTYFDTVTIKMTEVSDYYQTRKCTTYAKRIAK